MAQQVKAPATKSNNLSSIPGTHLVKRETSFFMLSSDLHTNDGMCASTDIHTINTHLHTINEQFNHKQKMQTLQLSICRCILQAKPKVPPWTKLWGTRRVNQWVHVLCIHHFVPAPLPLHVPHPIQTVLNGQLTEKEKHLTAPHWGTGLQSALMRLPYMHPTKMHGSYILALSRNSLEKQ